jgi:hypothetical protein
LLLHAFDDQAAYMLLVLSELVATSRSVPDVELLILVLTPF